MYRWLGKEQMPSLINTWLEQSVVIAPVRQGSVVVFQQLTKAEQAELSFLLNSRTPVKGFFLPQSEVMFRVEQGLFTSTAEEVKPQIILGLRSCDLQALRVLDGVFLSESQPDPYWAKKRESTTLVVVGCCEPGVDCFCTSVGLSPFESQGADVLLSQVEGFFLVKTLTKKGDLLFECLPEATNAQIEAGEKIQRKAATKMEIPFRIEGIKDRLVSLFESEVWSGLGQSCLGCGLCTYLCPTCHCFDIVDEAQRSERVRNWDSCLFHFYSQEASGHNPRPTVKERFRQRIMHKYVYFWERMAMIGCTGCGRCVRFCPVNLDLRHLIRTIQQFPGLSQGKEGV